MPTSRNTNNDRLEKNRRGRSVPTNTVNRTTLRLVWVMIMDQLDLVMFTSKVM